MAGAVTEQDAPAGQGGRAGVGQLLLIYLYDYSEAFVINH